MVEFPGIEPRSSLVTGDNHCRAVACATKGRNEFLRVRPLHSNSIKSKYSQIEYFDLMAGSVRFELTEGINPR